MTALTGTPPRPATTVWASALLILNAGPLLIPVSALVVFGLLTDQLKVRPEALAPAVTLAFVGAALLLTARAAWRGARWPSRFTIVVVAGDVLGLTLGYAFLALALALTAVAAIMLWQRSAREFTAAANASPVVGRQLLHQ